MSYITAKMAAALFFPTHPDAGDDASSPGIAEPLRFSLNTRSMLLAYLGEPDNADDLEERRKEKDAHVDCLSKFEPVLPGARWLDPYSRSVQANFVNTYHGFMEEQRAVAALAAACRRTRDLLMPGLRKRELFLVRSALDLLESNPREHARTAMTGAVESGACPRDAWRLLVATLRARAPWTVKERPRIADLAVKALAQHLAQHHCTRVPAR